MASSFRIWSSSTGISTHPLALFIVMRPNDHLTSDSRMSGSRWVITPSWLSGSLRIFCVVLLCILVTSFLYLLLLLVHTIYVFYWAHLCMKCPFGIANFLKEISQFSSVQFNSLTQSCLTLRPHELQHAQSTRKLMSIESVMPSIHLLSSVVPFSSCPQSLPASGSFPMSQLFASGGQSFGVSVSASVLPMNTQDWSPLGWTGWISLKSRRLLRVFSNTTVQKHQFFSTQLSSQPNSHIHTLPLEKPYPWLDGPLLAK